MMPILSRQKPEGRTSRTPDALGNLRHVVCRTFGYDASEPIVSALLPDFSATRVAERDSTDKDGLVPLIIHNLFGIGYAGQSTVGDLVHIASSETCEDQRHCWARIVGQVSTPGKH